MKRNDWLYIGILSMIYIVGIIILYSKGYLYGANVDWPTQHTMFPEYLRQQFYETGNLFPDFALNLGAGQNIYHISYYGLYNPIVLLSYLFPFIPMIDYMIITSILSVIISIILCYIWLKKHKLKSTTIKLSTIIFICAAPLILHSHKHLMFVNYIPFLFLSLLGIDKYFENKKIGLYTIGILGMILTSYYYSIGGILVSIIYGIHIYLKINKKITLKNFIKDGIQFIIPIFLSIGISALLLLPTLYVILHGRTGSSNSIPLLELLTPNIDINALVYSSYSIGLTAIIFFSLIHAFHTKKKENIFLSSMIILVISIPLIMYLLNGFLYIRAKVLIPFLPLCIYIIAQYLNDIFENKINLRIEIISMIGLIVGLLLIGYHNNTLYLECFILVIFLVLYHKKNKKYILTIPISIISIITLISCNITEEYQKIKEYNQAFSNEKKELITNITQQDKNFYRFNDLTNTLLTVNKTYKNYYQTSLYSSTYNQEYKNIFYNTFGNAFTYRNELVTSQSNNILFQTYMNVKYIITEIGAEPTHYQLQETKGNIGVYKNPYVYPIGYATNNIVNQSVYNTLTFPYNTETLLNSIVVENKGKNTITSNIKEIKLNYKTATNNLKITQYKKGYQIISKQKEQIKVSLNEEIEPGKILILKFKVENSQKCKEGDLSITINNITNKLTCKEWLYHNNNYDFKYILSSNQSIKELEVEFSKGTFEIIDQEAYIMDYKEIIKTRENLDEFIIDKDKTKDNKINGTIKVKEDGYFTISIPYENNFKILVDGKEQNYEQVNQAFIGFPIKEGTHKIEITYHAPWKNIGTIISSISIIIFISLLYRKRMK